MVQKSTFHGNHIQSNQNHLCKILHSEKISNLGHKNEQPGGNYAETMTLKKTKFCVSLMVYNANQTMLPHE